MLSCLRVRRCGQTGEGGHTLLEDILPNLTSHRAAFPPLTGEYINVTLISFLYMTPTGKSRAKYPSHTQSRLALMQTFFTSRQYLDHVLQDDIGPWSPVFFSSSCLHANIQIESVIAPVPNPGPNNTVEPWRVELVELIHNIVDIISIGNPL